MWQIVLSNMYTLQISEVRGVYPNLKECLEGLDTLITEECQKEIGDLRWGWRSIGDETEEHKKQRIELGLDWNFNN